MSELEKLVDAEFGSLTKAQYARARCLLLGDIGLLAEIRDKLA